MYLYDSLDRRLVDERVAQYRDQTRRYLSGEIGEEEFKALRLRNGLYIQRLAPMLRISIPYGVLSATQLRKLASICRDYDRGYAHVSTRQNMQLNWPALEDVPDILAELAEVEMHAIQTSGNCIRNITTDQFAGSARDEIEDPRPWCEIVRQWATFHPEFNYLPRKFKIAICASRDDRAAVAVHDIGLQIHHDSSGATRFRVLVGGGLGRTPCIGSVIHETLEAEHLLSYLEAILRVYNLHGRRDNIYKARIKILLKALGAEAFRKRVDAEWERIKDGPARLDASEIKRVKSFFTPPDLPEMDVDRVGADIAQHKLSSPPFERWLRSNTLPHRLDGYAIVNLSLKRTGVPPGDISDAEMEAVADLSERYGQGEIRTTHEQNMVLPDVAGDKLHSLWRELETLELATPNIGRIGDIICCPGGDYCSLANAKSIPIAEAIQRRFEDLDYQHDLGELNLNISGCMNACGHHHVGHIGVLGVDKKGKEFYQVSLGGNAGRGADASLGVILGPSFSQERIPDIVAEIIEIYLAEREGEESFLHTYSRIGIEPFRKRVYAE